MFFGGFPGGGFPGGFPGDDDDMGGGFPGRGGPKKPVRSKSFFEKTFSVLEELEVSFLWECVDEKGRFD